MVVAARYGPRSTICEEQPPLRLGGEPQSPHLSWITCVTNDTPDEDDGRGGVKEAGWGFGGPFEVLGQASITADPCGGALDDRQLPPLVQA